jgi:hypothetical protein
MHKEKREKTTKTYVPFPEGIHTIWFEPSEPPHEMRILGRINLISILIDDEIAFVGAIHFHEDLKNVGNNPYPLTVTYIPEGGAINFHVLGATREFGNVDSPFRFVFDGTCEKTFESIVISGRSPVGLYPDSPASRTWRVCNLDIQGPRRSESQTFKMRLYYGSPR